MWCFGGANATWIYRWDFALWGDLKKVLKLEFLLENVKCLACMSLMRLRSSTIGLNSVLTALLPILWSNKKKKKNQKLSLDYGSDLTILLSNLCGIFLSLNSHCSTLMENVFVDCSGDRSVVVLRTNFFSIFYLPSNVGDTGPGNTSPGDGRIWHVLVSEFKSRNSRKQHFFLLFLLYLLVETRNKKDRYSCGSVGGFEETASFFLLFHRETN